jgi:hypothetical protein
MDVPFVYLRKSAQRSRSGVEGGGLGQDRSPPRPSWLTPIMPERSQDLGDWLEHVIDEDTGPAAQVALRSVSTVSLTCVGSAHLRLCRSLPWEHYALRVAR